MTTRQRKQDLVKLRILSFLGEPAQQEFGALTHDIKRGIPSETMVDEERMLKVLVDDGLVERRNDAADKKAKPYFITPRGVRFLEEQTQKAIHPEFEIKGNWAHEHGQLKLDDAVSDFIRALPEFLRAGEKRVQEVSAGLSRFIKEHISRTL